MIMWIMSDRAIPRSFRFMEGFGVHTFRLVNADGKSTFVKFHWKPKQGMQSVVWNEAVKINGADPDFHRRDLWDAIETGDFPEWELGLQLFDEDFADTLRLRRARRHQDHPGGRAAGAARRAGWCSTAWSTTSSPRPSRSRSAPRTSCPASTSPTTRCCRAATSPTSTPSSSASAARTSRISRSTRRKCPFHNFQQDGHMAMRNPKGRVNYEPNSWGGDGGPRESPERGFRPTRPRRAGRSCASGPRPSPTTTARRGSSTSARPRSSSATSPHALTFELSKVETLAIRARMVVAPAQYRRGPGHEGRRRACG